MAARTSIMSLLKRKQFELASKLESLDHEFREWITASSKADGPLAKHQSQIQRITDQLRGYARTLDGAAVSLAAAQELEQKTLDLHRLWEHFRSKFAQRHVPHLSEHLYACDELAWSCYQKAQAALLPGQLTELDLKEPPLVFFNAEWSPYVAPRNAAYTADSFPDLERVAPQLGPILRRLPVPLIGIPWHQSRHLPDALVVAHEVGHVVEDDLKLTPRLTALLGAAKLDARRSGAWSEWQGEIFADVFGVVALGPAFAGALTDFLAGDPPAIEAQVRTGPHWTVYPTRYLRVLIVAETLRQTGFGADADALVDDWRAVYKKHAMGVFVPDVAHVVRALLDGPYPELSGKALTALFEHADATAKVHEKALHNRDVLLAKKRDSVEGTGVRVLMATARLTFAADPDNFTKRDLGAAILKRLPRTKGVRSRTRSTATAERLSTDDLDAGAKLFEA